MSISKNHNVKKQLEQIEQKKHLDDVGQLSGHHLFLTLKIMQIAGDARPFKRFKDRMYFQDRRNAKLLEIELVKKMAKKRMAMRNQAIRENFQGKSLSDLENDARELRIDVNLIKKNLFIKEYLRIFYQNRRDLEAREAKKILSQQSLEQVKEYSSFINIDKGQLATELKNELAIHIANLITSNSKEVIEYEDELLIKSLDELKKDASQLQIESKYNTKEIRMQCPKDLNYLFAKAFRGFSPSQLKEASIILSRMPDKFLHDNPFLGPLLKSEFKRRNIKQPNIKKNNGVVKLIEINQHMFKMKEMKGMLAKISDYDGKVVDRELTYLAKNFVDIFSKHDEIDRNTLITSYLTDGKTRVAILRLLHNYLQTLPIITEDIKKNISCLVKLLRLNGCDAPMGIEQKVCDEIKKTVEDHQDQSSIIFSGEHLSLVIEHAAKTGDLQPAIDILQSESFYQHRREKLLKYKVIDKIVTKKLEKNRMHNSEQKKSIFDYNEEFSNEEKVAIKEKVANNALAFLINEARASGVDVEYSLQEVIRKHMVSEYGKHKTKNDIEDMLGSQSLSDWQKELNENGIDIDYQYKRYMAEEIIRQDKCRNDHCARQKKSLKNNTLEQLKEIAKSLPIEINYDKEPSMATEEILSIFSDMLIELSIDRRNKLGKLVENIDVSSYRENGQEVLVCRWLKTVFRIPEVVNGILAKDSLKEILQCSPDTISQVNFEKIVGCIHNVSLIKLVNDKDQTELFNYVKQFNAADKVVSRLLDDYMKKKNPQILKKLLAFYVFNLEKGGIVISNKVKQDIAMLSNKLNKDDHNGHDLSTEVKSDIPGSGDVHRNDIDLRKSDDENAIDRVILTGIYSIELDLDYETINPESAIKKMLQLREKFFCYKLENVKTRQYFSDVLETMKKKYLIQKVKELINYYRHKQYGNSGNKKALTLIFCSKQEYYEKILLILQCFLIVLMGDKLSQNHYDSLLKLKAETCSKSSKQMHDHVSSNSMPAIQLESDLENLSLGKYDQKKVIETIDIVSGTLGGYDQLNLFKKTKKNTEMIQLVAEAKVLFGCDN